MQIDKKKLKEIKDRVVLLDVRTPDEFRSGHITDAVNINIYDIKFLEEVKKLDKNKEYVIYCNSSTGRCKKASKKMKTAGIKKVRSLKGGYLSWIKD